MDFEIPVGDEQEYDYDSEIAAIEEVIALLSEDLWSKRANKQLLRATIGLLERYADQLNDEKEGNA